MRRPSTGPSKGFLRSSADPTILCGSWSLVRVRRAPAQADHVHAHLAAAAAVTPPKGCESTESHERKFTAAAEFCEDYARSLAAPPKPSRGKKRGRQKKPDPTAIVKLMDAAIKARRAASSLARMREDDAEAMRIEELDAAQASGGTH